MNSIQLQPLHPILAPLNREPAVGFPAPLSENSWVDTILTGRPPSQLFDGIFPAADEFPITQFPEAFVMGIPLHAGSVVAHGLPVLISEGAGAPPYQQHQQAPPQAMVMEYPRHHPSAGSAQETPFRPNQEPPHKIPAGCFDYCVSGLRCCLITEECYRENGNFCPSCCGCVTDICDGLSGIFS